MGSRNNTRLPQFGERDATPSMYTEAGRSLAVNVIFTTTRGTLAALKTASNLARRLNASIHLRVVQVVPFALPLDYPPVSVAFIEERCRSLALECEEVSEVKVDVYLCRDRRDTLRRLLRPRALIVIGGRQRCWGTPEQKLANWLQDAGHHVIFTDISCHSAERTAPQGSSGAVSIWLRRTMTNGFENVKRTRQST